MKIAIVVHGRFHAFDFAKALMRRGHEITILTNYPKWATRKFDIPDQTVRAFWVHGVLYRIFHKLSNSGLRWDTSAFLNPLFGRWATAQVAKDSYDVVHCFTGVACELLAAHKKGARPVHLIVRGSSHIVTQDELLREEEQRSNRRMERPSRTAIEREQREYELADRIVVLSNFAAQSFALQGVPERRLALLPLGVNVDDFRASEDVLQERCRRILSGAPLRVLWVGTMSLRKGLLDYIQIVQALAGENFAFRFVGDIPTDLRPIAAGLSSSVEFISRQKQSDLRQQYNWGDVFVFPTVEDGFAVVLLQAAANGLPILTTTNSAGPDMIHQDETGWVLPIRSPEAFIERLRWCDRNREVVAKMVNRTSQEFVPRTWDNVAVDFEKLCQDTIEKVVEGAKTANKAH